MVGALVLVVGGVPERMVFGCLEGAAVGFELEEGVGVDPEVGDLAGSTFSGLRVGGEDLVPYLHVCDRLAGSVGHLDRCGPGEAAESSA